MTTVRPLSPAASLVSVVDWPDPARGTADKWRIYFDVKLFLIRKEVGKKPSKVDFRQVTICYVLFDWGFWHGG